MAAHTITTPEISEVERCEAALGLEHQLSEDFIGAVRQLESGSIFGDWRDENPVLRELSALATLGASFDGSRDELKAMRSEALAIITAEKEFVPNVDSVADEAVPVGQQSNVTQEVLAPEVDDTQRHPSDNVIPIDRATARQEILAGTVAGMQ